MNGSGDGNEKKAMIFARIIVFWWILIQIYLVYSDYSHASISATVFGLLFIVLPSVALVCSFNGGRFGACAMGVFIIAYPSAIFVLMDIYVLHANGMALAFGIVAQSALFWFVGFTILRGTFSRKS